jgi:hypothetical protein
MYSAGHEDHLLVRIGFMDIIWDSQYIARVCINGSAQFLHFQRIFHRTHTFIPFLLQSENVIFQVWVCVRLEVWEKNDVIVVFEGVAESKGIQICGLRLFILVDIESDIILVVLIVRLETWNDN